MITKTNPLNGARTLLGGAPMYRRAFQVDPYHCVRPPTLQLGAEADVLRNTRVVSRKPHPLLVAYS
jgi:hypothetical protein